MAHASDAQDDSHDRDDTIDPKEAAHFGALAADWWDPKGSSAMLHKLNPVRLGYIRDRIDQHWGGDETRPAAARRASAPPTSAAAPACSPSRWRGWARR